MRVQRMDIQNQAREEKNVSCEWYSAYKYYDFRTIFSSLFIFAAASRSSHSLWWNWFFPYRHATLFLFYGPWMKPDPHDAKQMRKIMHRDFIGYGNFRI